MYCPGRDWRKYLRGGKASEAQVGTCEILADIPVKTRNRSCTDRILGCRRKVGRTHPLSSQRVKRPLARSLLPWERSRGPLQEPCARGCVLARSFHARAAERRDRGAHGEVRLRGRGLHRRRVRASPASSRPRWAGARGAGLGRRLGTQLAPAALGVAGSVSLRLPGTGMTHLPTSIVSTSLQRLQSSHETPRTRRAPRSRFYSHGTAPRPAAAQSGRGVTQPCRGRALQASTSLGGVAPASPPTERTQWACRPEARRLGLGASGPPGASGQLE